MRLPALLTSSAALDALELSLRTGLMSTALALLLGAPLAIVLARSRIRGIRVVRAPCVGRCDRAPVAVVGQRAVEGATPDAVAATVAEGDLVPVVLDYPGYDAYIAGGGYRLLRECLAGGRDREGLIAVGRSVSGSWTRISSWQLLQRKMRPFLQVRSGSLSAASWPGVTSLMSCQSSSPCECWVLSLRRVRALRRGTSD